ncbi:MAG: ECF-type sigma factor [Xanthomonadales bacterium]|nr:ECF-type sigma factor [Xanthomonadales bacterium]
MSEITELLVQARNGEAEPIQAVFALLYPQLRHMAAARLRRSESTFTPTALVHELFLRVTADDAKLSMADHHHFFAAAAQAMRWIVVDQARVRSAQKRGGGVAPITLDEKLIGSVDADADVLALNDGLQLLDEINPRQREVVELHFFAGLSFPRIGELLQCSESTAKRDWQCARAFLYTQLAET